MVMDEIIYEVQHNSVLVGIVSGCQVGEGGDITDVLWSAARSL